MLLFDLIGEKYKENGKCEKNLLILRIATILIVCIKKARLFSNVLFC